MFKQKTLLRIAAFLTLFTAAGHTAGTFMPIPTEQVGLIAAYRTMAETMIPMPIGSPQSIADVFFGNNLVTSLFLLIAGLHLIFAFPERRSLLLLGTGLGAIALISAVYFFPLPAICTGLASVLTIAAARQTDRTA
ncbi:MAG: hypothetical protein F9K24_00195 [Leptonema illini]|jgi:hypothetical protein|uniref:Uncharacterized protein n=1 Tax=Leptonema illini TaxID=183 RepID=A0A833M079_9LEPT|nr:MAG: hypothetical protein F9K24_00195 [Leptonema illini]